MAGTDPGFRRMAETRLDSRPFSRRQKMPRWAYNARRVAAGEGDAETRTQPRRAERFTSRTARLVTARRSTEVTVEPPRWWASRTGSTMAPSRGRSRREEGYRL